MNNIHFKIINDCGYKEKYHYYIYNKSICIGEISFIIKDKLFIIGFMGIEEKYRHNNFGYDVIEYILSHYKVKAIVGQTVNKSKGFWNKCIKKYNGTRKNISTLRNCSSSFIIPKVEINHDSLYKYLELSSIIE